jgi:Icc-related predicted phosphoesterase
MMKLAAVADVHFRPEDQEQNIRAFSAVNEIADLLVLAGDLTNHGRLEEMEACLKVLAHVNIPMVAVLGNHDHESGQQDILAGRARVAGIHVLDGTCFEHDGVGFAGTKGFCGGFAPYELMPFGEEAIKEFVEIAEREAIKLDYGLAQLGTDRKVAITHYAPVLETIVGEPEAIFPFLGSSRLGRVIEQHRPALALHGHAHHGSFATNSAAGTPIHNVALPILRKRQEEHPFALFDI